MNRLQVRDLLIMNFSKFSGSCRTAHAPRRPLIGRFHFHGILHASLNKYIHISRMQNIREGKQN